MDWNNIAEILSSASKYITQKIVEVLAKYNFNVTERWVGTLLTLVLLVIIWLSMKISKPLLKYAIIGLSLLLIVGLVIPIW